MNTSYICEPCDKIFNGIRPYEDHLASEKHNKNMNPAFSIVEGSSRLGSGSGTLETDHYIQKCGTGYKCLACNIDLNGITPAQTHARGEKHLKTIRNNMHSSGSGIATGIKEALKASPPFSKNEDSSTLVYESGRLETDQYIKKYGTGYKCSACNIELNGRIPAETHVRGEKHKKSIKNRMHFSYNETNSSTLFDSDNLDKIDHEFSLHIIGVEDLLKEIKILKVNDPIEF